MKVHLVTFGCRLNQAETAHAADALQRGGYVILSEADGADVIIVNGCAVTGTASQKTRQALHTLRKRHSDALIVLMGCNTVEDRQKAVDGGYADLVLSHQQANNLCALIGQALQDRAGQGRAGGLRLSKTTSGPTVPTIAHTILRWTAPRVLRSARAPT